MDDNKKLIESIKKNIQVRTIPTNRRYWFVRTFGGKLFEYYYSTNKVGIIGNDVPLEYIKNAKHDDVTFNTLQQYIFSNIYNENQSESTKLANQLVRFYHEINIGDIVMIPSEDSNYIAIGEITSEVKLQKSAATIMHNDVIYPYPEKIRKVKWIKIMKKSEVVGDLRSLFSSHLGLTNADKYGDFIESNISTNFIKEDEVYTAFYINQDENINAFELKDFLDSVTTIYKELCKEFGEEDNNELYIKIKVQSRGSTILKGAAVAASLCLAVYITTISNNSEFKANIAGVIEVEYKTDGDPLKSINDYKRESNNIKYEGAKLERKQIIEGLEDQILIEQLEDSLNKIKNKKIEEAKVTLQKSAKALEIAPIESSSKSLKEIQ